MLDENVDTRYYLNPVKVQNFVKDNMVMIDSYVRKSDEEIEQLPQYIKEWMDGYDESSDVWSYCLSQCKYVDILQRYKRTISSQVHQTFYIGMMAFLI